MRSHDPDSIDLRDELARIDRSRAETEKFAAETRKLVAEQFKLSAEGRKFGRDRFLAPSTLIVATAGGFAAFFAAGATFMQNCSGHWSNAA